ncbi:hypothetical protein K1719_000048 [Acacia pycnantha]|nr:hypothetical protein K1719_000048 [Acacia pycnantha]
MDQKWMMLVVDGSKSMGPHWPNIFSNFVEKINAKHAKVKFGLIMYNVKHNDDTTEWPVEGSYWTSKEDEFVNKLSSLTFNGTDRTFNPFTVHALAEALVMFPKPPIGKESMEEYYEGERHCIVIPATQPSNIRINVHLPKIHGCHPFGSHTVSSFSHCFHVSEFYAKLGVTLSVITPKLCSGWRAIFGQANNYSIKEDEDNGVSVIGSLSVLIAPKFKEATEALTDLDPFFSDEGIDFFISSLMDDDEAAANNCHQNSIITNTTPAQTPQLPELLNSQGCSSSLPSQNLRVNDDDIAASLIAQGFTNENPNNLLPAAAYYWMSAEEQEILNNLRENDDDIAASLIDQGFTNETPNNLLPAAANCWMSAEEQDILNNLSCNNNNNIINTTNSFHYSAMIEPSLLQSRSSCTVMGSIPPVEENSRANNINNEAVGTEEPSTDNHDVINNGGSRGDNNDDNGGGAPSSLLSRRREKRAVDSNGKGPEGRRGRRQRVTSDMNSTLHNDLLLKSQVSSSPLRHNPFHVACWEGGIAVGNSGNFRVIASAKVYRKRTAPQTITEGWPLWLHIGDFITHNALSAMRSSQTPIDDVDIEMLKTNQDQLFKFMSSRDVHARINLPSQMLILSPTSEPSRFVGTLFQGIEPWVADFAFGRIPNEDLQVMS